MAGLAGFLLPWGSVGCDFLGRRTGSGGWLAKDPGIGVHVGTVYGGPLGVYLVLYSGVALGLPRRFWLP